MAVTLVKAQTQTCQWRGLPAMGIRETCGHVATLTGQNLDSGEQHLCTAHMAERQSIGHGRFRYEWVWPCTNNGYSLTGAKPLPWIAARLCR